MALTPEDLRAISDMMDSKLQVMQTATDARFNKMENRFNTMENRFDAMEASINELKVQVAEIKEDTEITRVTTNALVAWTEQVAILTQVKFPVKEA